MNAALIPAEIQALNQPDRSCEDANRQLGHAGAHRDAADSTTFEESMRLKNTLDAYEAQGKPPSAHRTSCCRGVPLTRFQQLSLSPHGRHSLCL
jgi:hypothetical protein